MKVGTFEHYVGRVHGICSAAPTARCLYAGNLMALS